MGIKSPLLLALLTVGFGLAQNILQLPDSLRASTDTVKWVKRVPRYCEGPAWEPSTGAVYFTEQRGSGVAIWPIWKVTPGNATDTGSIFVNTYQSNGLAFDPQGRLVACQNGRLSRYNSNGTLDTTLVVSGANGVAFGLANDLSIGSNGAIYFTQNQTQVYYLSPGRQLTVAISSTTADTIANANGIEWIEEKNTVFMNMTGTMARIRRYTVGTNGTLTNPVLFKASPGPDGGAFDSHGNYYVSDNVNGRVRVFNANSDSVGNIPLRLATGSYDANAGVRSNVSNCVFGGADLKTLYITGDGGLYSIQLKIAGRTRPSTAISRFQIRPMNRVASGLIIDLRGRWLENPAKRMPVLKVFR